MSFNPESPVWRRFLPSPDDDAASEIPSASAHAGQSVLVTGAAGFIGSALVKAIAAAGPRWLVLLDTSEHKLFELDQDLELAFGQAPREIVLGRVDDTEMLERIFTRFHPEIVYHAAALKHVPLLELNPIAAVRTNSIGTYVLAQAAFLHGTSQFILISTDKAVNPHSIMGASKRIAELAIVAMSTKGCRMNAIRLANVIGSPGSVVPLFRKQIDEGGPVTVTHPEATRWFLSPREAVDAVLAAGNAACEGKILVPELGEPVRIADLAAFLIASREIPIRFTRLRPGDKLTEEAVSRAEIEAGTAEGLRVIETQKPSSTFIEAMVERLSRRIADNDAAGLVRDVSSVVPEYVPSGLLQ